MYHVLYMDEAENCIKKQDPKLWEAFCDGSRENFESFPEADLFSFPMYEVSCPGMNKNQILIYYTQKELFFFCEGKHGYEKTSAMVAGAEQDEEILWRFFQNLLKHDMDYLEDLEYEIAEAEMEAMVRFRDANIYKVVAYRKELLKLKRYYEQLDTIMDHLAENENQLLTEEAVKHYKILAKKTARYLANVQNLRDYVTQMRETYQAQLDIEQNGLMRVFTVITAVFLPMTLMTGWYGMNFNGMPELAWKYGYPVFAGVSAAVCLGMLWYFRKRKLL